MSTQKSLNLKTLDQLKDETLGKVGTHRRDDYEREFENFAIGVIVRNARESQNLTQSQLAEKIGKKREYISRVENDANNVTLRSLRRIVEQGFGGKLRIEIDLGNPDKKEGIREEEVKEHLLIETTV